jgi:hypothetical protein
MRAADVLMVGERIDFSLAQYPLAPRRSPIVARKVPGLPTHKGNRS